MMNKRYRLFYLAWTPPSENGGACLAMRRHLVLRSDFELFVVTSSPFHDEQVPSLPMPRHALLKRISNTRFSRLVHQFEMLVEPCRIPRSVLDVAKAFRPDAILTVADNTISWTAYRLARRLNVPLITNFQDWWPRGQFSLDLQKPFPPVRSHLERRFRSLYHRSALAFCTSQGMMDYLGPHSNARVLFPSPAPRDPSYVPTFEIPAPGRPRRIVYAGTIINAYGRAVLELARRLRGDSRYEFQVYGPQPDWPTRDLEWMRDEGIYRGLLSHKELQDRLRKADVFLVVMTFDEQLRTMMETSFTTKFLEYSQYGKPIIVWGPPYCQPVKLISSGEAAGIVVTEPSPGAVVSALEDLESDDLWQGTARGAWAAANGIFDPAEIHRGFVSSIHQTLANS